MSYLLDADVFIRAKNLHYGLDFCPAFWDWLAHKGNTGTVFSIDKVADEIEAGQDEFRVGNACMSAQAALEGDRTWPVST